MATSRQIIAGNLESVRSRMADACRRSTRDASSVRLVAVTKAVGGDEAKSLVELGALDLGENRVPDGIAKMDALDDESVRWHMIGHLQRRKVRHAVGRFAMLHSVDSVRLLDEIEKRSAAAGVVTDILAEVNVSAEEAKYGLQPGEAPSFCEAAARCDNVRLSGLMTMAPFVDDPEDARHVFSALRELLEGLNGQSACSQKLSELSMGMTNDFEVAIEEGATIVRIGTALYC